MKLLNAMSTIEALVHAGTQVLLYNGSEVLSLSLNTGSDNELIVLEHTLDYELESNWEQETLYWNSYTGMKDAKSVIQSFINEQTELEVA